MQNYTATQKNVTYRHPEPFDCSQDKLREGSPSNDAMARSLRAGEAGFGKKHLKMTDFVLLVCLFFLANSAYAAEESPIDQATTELSTQIQAVQEQPPAPPAKKEEKVEIQKKEEKLEHEEELAGPKFVVKKILLEGNTILPTKDFELFFKEYLNRENSFKELKALAKKITDVYRQKGFISSRAYLPPQKIENGVVTIRVIEGRVGNIVVEDNHFFSKEVFKKSIHLRPDKALNYSDLGADLYYANLKPDRKTKVYLVPGAEPETSDIVLKVQDNYPIHAYGFFNNHGSKFTHLARQGGFLVDNNVTGHADTGQLSYSMAEEGAIRAGSLGYSFPIQQTGTTLKLDASYANSLVVKHLKSAEVKGDSLSVVPTISQEFIRRTDFLLEGSLGFEIKDSKTMINDLKTSFDRMRILKAGPKMTLRDGLGRTSFDAAIHWGIPNFLGGLKENDIKASKPNSGGDFMYYTIEASRVHALPWNFYMILKADGQWTNDTLTSTEQYRLGGSSSVRGYPESDSVGDYGYTCSAELSAPVMWMPSDWEMPWIKKKWKDSLRLVGFLDFGQNYLRERVLDTTEKSRSLMGAGVGIRFTLDQNFSLTLDYAWPIGDKSSNQDPYQIHLSIVAGF